MTFNGCKNPSNTLKHPKSFLNFKEENERIISKAVHAAPHVAHDPIDAVNELEFFRSIAQFRDQNGKTRVEFTLVSPLKKNLADKFSSKSEDTLKVQFDALIRDEKFYPISKESMKMTLPVKLAVLENLPNAVGRLVTTLPPQKGELTLQVKNAINSDLGFSREPFTIRDFSNGKIDMSDMQFFVEVRNEIQRSILPTMNKQNLEIAPYPYENVRKSTPLVCYFEIYNLKRAGMTDEYRITYHLVKLKGRESVLKRVFKFLTFSKEKSISISYDQPIVDNITRELITIDLSKVSTGPHRLEIRVRDKMNKEIAAKTSKDIIVENLD